MMSDNINENEFLKNKRLILYIAVSSLIGFISIPIHEFGHVIGNFVTNIPTGMSYAREYTLNGQAESISGILGGPVLTVVLSYIGLLMIYRKRYLVFAYPFTIIMCVDRIYVYLWCFSTMDIKRYLELGGLFGMDERGAAERLNIDPYTFFMLIQILELVVLIFIIYHLRFVLKKNLSIVLIPVIFTCIMRYIGINFIERNLFWEQYNHQFSNPVPTIKNDLIVGAILILAISITIMGANFIKRSSKTKTLFITISLIFSIPISAITFSIINKSISDASEITVYSSNVAKPSGYSPQIEAYVNFLNSAPLTDPVDYVIKLFDKYDIVILCERDHRDITQYELFYKIISDKRFIEKSGRIFTEVGTQTVNNRLNTLLKDKKLIGDAFDKQLMSLYRDLDKNVYWDKYNLFDFLKKVKGLNNSLTDKEQISINFSDMPIDWTTVTEDVYKQEITDEIRNRDIIMADYIAAEYKKIKNSESEKKKLLVIMNYRHAFKTMIDIGENVGFCLDKEFPGKVANVMINSLKLLPGTNNYNDIREPIQDGKWDAAFRYTGNRNIAFDFKNTPFGMDHFDYYDFIPNDQTYENSFNGFIFYRPLEEHLLVCGIPGFVDKEFYPTLIKRLNIIDPVEKRNATKSNYKNFAAIYNTKKEFTYPDMISYNAKIEQWLKFN